MDERRPATCWKGVAAGVMVSASAAFQHFKLPPVLPDLVAEYPVEPGVAALFMSVFALIGLFVSQPLGRWLDRFGLMRALLASALLFAAGGALALIAPERWPLFLAGRGLESLGFAIAAIAGPIIAARSAAARDLPLVTGLLAGWVPMGQIFASALTALYPDWRFLWAVGLLVALMTAIVAARRIWTGGDGPPTPSPTARTASSDRHSPSAKHWVAAGIFMVWSIQYMAFATWLPDFADRRFGLDLRTGTAAYVLPAVFILVFNVLAGWALGKGAPILTLLAGALLLQALVWILGPFVEGAQAFWLLAIYGIGAGIAPACLFHLPHYLEGGKAGAAAFGTLMTGRNLGGFLGPLLFPLLVDRDAQSLMGFSWFVGVLGIGLAGAYWLTRLPRPAQGANR